MKYQPATVVSVGVVQTFDSLNDFISVMRNIFRSIILLVLLNGSISYANSAASRVFDIAKKVTYVVKTADGKSQGSAVSVASDRGITLLVTNCHVVGDSKKVSLTNGSTKLDGDVDYCSKKFDVAFIGVEKSLVTVDVRSAGKPLKIGEEIFAVGAPRGLDLTITNGIISQLRLRYEGVDPLIQITAAISPGSSGGGVFDNTGKLIGFTTFLLKDAQSLNFAIPFDFVRASIKEADSLKNGALPSGERLMREKDDGAKPESGNKDRTPDKGPKLDVPTEELDTLYPNWMEIVNTQGYQNWLKSKSAAFRRNLMNARTANEFASAFDLYSIEYAKNFDSEKCRPYAKPSMLARIQCRIHIQNQRMEEARSRGGNFDRSPMYLGSIKRWKDLLEAFSRGDVTGEDVAVHLQLLIKADIESTYIQ